MQLQELRVNGLFGHFDHVVPLNVKEKITIITAPNGFGKTVVLKILNSFFSSNLGYIKSLDFTSIEIIFADLVVKIKKHGANENQTLEISVPGDKRRTWRYEDMKYDRNTHQFPLGAIDKHLDWLDRTGPEEWYDHMIDQEINLAQVFERYREHLPYDYTRPDQNIPEWLAPILASFNPHLIQDQRLIQRSGIHRNQNRKAGPATIDTIEKYARELAGDIKASLTGSAEISQKLDSQFPNRLIRGSINSFDADTLKSKLKALKEKRERLSVHGLISQEAMPSQFISDTEEINDDDRKVLTLYVGDTEKKLDVYDGLLKKIELFTTILNTKRLSFKKVKTSAEKGFFFQTDKDQPLKLTQLSSGEQHEVILLYELIFRAKENVLLLIDEPEISLHVVWQKEFLKDLKTIIEEKDVTVLISTHSPQIIGDNWNLTVNLGEGI